MTHPLLSIIIPNYNHERFLPDTIDSILAQEFDDFELIIGDDGSTDDSVHVIERYGNAIRPFFFKKNRGYFAVVKELLNLAKGKYVHVFSSDDLYLPHFLSESMNLLLTENLKLTCTDIRYFLSDQPQINRVTHLCQAKEASIFQKSEIVNIFRKSNFWVPGVSCIVTLETLKKYGPHNPQLENLSDWFLFHHIALYEGVDYIPKVGIAMRENSDSYTKTVKKDRKRRNATYWKILEIVSQDREMRRKFRHSTLLTFIFENLFWKLIFRPVWWDFFLFNPKLSVIKRLKRSLRKRILHVQAT